MVSEILKIFRLKSPKVIVYSDWSTGAGKTTLMDCFAKDKFLTAGEARIQGLKPTDNHLKQFAKTTSGARKRTKTRCA